MATLREAIRKDDVEALRSHLDAHPAWMNELYEDLGLVNGEWDVLSEDYPLVLACQDGSLRCARLLIDRGAYMEGHNGSGRTPLYEAAAYGHPELVSLLLARGADPAVRTARLETPLMAAASGDRGTEFKYVAVLRLLLNDGRVSVDAMCEDGQTALHHACMGGYASRVRALLEGGADPHVYPAGVSAMNLALELGHLLCAKLLQDYMDNRDKPFLLSKARAFVFDPNRISKAPVTMEATDEMEAQQAREEIAPVYLKDRVRQGGPLPRLELVEPRKDGNKFKWEREAGERGPVCEFVVKWLSEDLYMELMAGISYHRKE